MPSNLVKKGQESEWNKAKALVKKQYPNIDTGSSRYWKIVTSIFKNMVGKTKTKSNSELEKTITK